MGNKRIKLVFATTNPGKIDELRALVADLPIDVVSQEEVEATSILEDGDTLEENAEKKAVVFSKRTGLPALADDTGLCVDALDGGPGVWSARFAEDEMVGSGAQARYQANNRKLLRVLGDVPPERRGAEFRCALCLSAPGKSAVIVTGVCRGRIVGEGRGQKGFGYDPLFEIPELGRTFAELTTEEKNRMSHRAKAFQAIKPHLEKLVTGER